MSNRSLQSYMEIKLALLSGATQQATKYALDKFERFAREKQKSTTEDLVLKFQTDNEYAYDILQLWINWLGSGEKPIQPRTVRFYFSAVRKYLYYRGVKFQDYDISQNLTFPKIAEIDKHGLTLKEIKMILDNMRPKKKALFLTQLSSGMRIGEVVQLRKKDFDLSKSRICIRLSASITKLRRARVTFISKEAEMYVKPILEKINDNDLVFGTNDNFVKARQNEIKILVKVLHDLGLDQKDENGNSLISTHSFRAYFITKVSRLDHNLAKLYAGQKGYLLQYDRIDIDEKLEKYIEFEPELLIYETPFKDEELLKMKEKLNYVYDVLTKLNDYGESKSNEGITADEFNEMLKSLKK